MNRIVTALYSTTGQAEAARDALIAAHLGQQVEIRDRDAADKPGLGDWLARDFGGHHDKHAYKEGLRRGHILLSAKVDALNEIRVAAILHAAAPIDLHDVQTAWRGEGWTPPETAAEPAKVTEPVESAAGAVDSEMSGGGVRFYVIEG